uniref:CP n=2 Tax=unclassified Closteroviridae TaxID=217429 RepID=A0A7U3VZU9_9CLOS|nr:CP [Closteroviridae sp.]UVT34987.1 coat protein duplicate 1-like protein [peony leafroll-associated virus]UXV25355.1 CPm [peony leafroll-associated virus]
MSMNAGTLVDFYTSLDKYRKETKKAIDDLAAGKSLTPSTKGVPEGAYSIFRYKIVNRLIKLVFKVDNGKKKPGERYEIGLFVRSPSLGSLGIVAKTVDGDAIEVEVTSWTRAGGLTYTHSKRRVEIKTPGEEHTLSIDSGALVSYCYYYLDGGLIYSHTAMPVNVSYQPGYVQLANIRKIDAKDYLMGKDSENLSNPFDVSSVTVDYDVSGRGEDLYVENKSNVVEARHRDFIRGIKDVEDKKAAEEQRHDHSNLQPTAGDVSPPSSEQSEEKVKSIEEVGRLIRDIREIARSDDDTPILDYKDLPTIRVSGELSIHMVSKLDCSLVNDNILERIRRDYGEADKKTTRIVMLAILQSALTYSTCSTRYTINRGEIKISTDTGSTTVYTDDYVETIVSTLEGKGYLNPLRQYLRWWSNTTIHLIKTGILKPNEYVQARWGVTKKFLPYCFDFCVMSAKYNTRDEKLAAALARRTALSNAYKSFGKGNEELHNASELSG